jgi:hypothetical protein
VGKLYRVAQAEILEDENTELPQQRHIEEITRLFRAVFEQHGVIDPEMLALLESHIPLGTLTDIIAHALGLPPAVKQRLLAETRVNHRGEFLVQVLRQILPRESESVRVAGAGAFPPPFSDN